MSRLIDMTGKRIGDFTVIRQSSARTKSHCTYWTCKCECGIEKDVSGSWLRSGNNISCFQCGIEKRSKHRKCNSPEYKVWSGIKQRCLNPNEPNYSRYGARGIKIDKRWEKSFVDFLNDVGTRPEPGYELDRIDNNGNYEPGNVRWATKKENNRNTRRSRYVLHNGEYITLAELSEITGIKYGTLLGRLSRGDIGEKLIRKVNKIYLGVEE